MKSKGILIVTGVLALGSAGAYGLISFNGGSQTNLISIIDDNPHTYIDEKITRNFQDKERGARTLSRSLGKKKVDLIRDYSIRLSNSINCTGWFLDYEIPKEPKKYPTKWFIVTNLHCILNTFFKEESYPQDLSGVSSVLLSKERLDVSEDPIVEFNYENWLSHSLNKKKQLTIYSTKEDTVKTMDNPQPDVWTYLDTHPKLIYAAVDFLGNFEKVKRIGYPFDVPKYYKDFAVLEVNFDTEEQAQRTTWDFYNKYDPAVGTKKDEAINFFAEELIARKTPDQLIEEQEDIFIAGYPENSWHRNISVSNYDEKRKSASRLTIGLNSFLIKNKKGEEIIGHLDGGAILDDYIKHNPKRELHWGPYPMRAWGYRYLIDFPIIRHGASGSLGMDSSNNLLGLYSFVWDNYGGIEPIRSKGIYRDGKTISPKYDLIEGTEGQVSSYRSQIEKYILSKGIQTNLSRQRGWVSQLP